MLKKNAMDKLEDGGHTNFKVSPNSFQDSEMFRFLPKIK